MRSSVIAQALFLRVSLVLFLVAGAAPGAPVEVTPPISRLEITASDGHPLSVWQKRPREPRAAILLVHGRTWSARPNFDLQVQGEHVSLMDQLVEHGFAAYALDQRGYGQTPRDASGWLTPDRAAEDIATVLDSIRERERRPVILLGYSRGSIIVTLVAQRYPSKLDGLVVYAFPYDIDERRPATPPSATPSRTATTAADAGSDFITPEAVSKTVVDAYVKSALACDPVRTDWRDDDQLDVLDPAAIHVPTLLIHGERDPLARVAFGAKLFSLLGAGQRQWTILPGCDHAAHVEKCHSQFVDAIDAFFARATSEKHKGA